MRYWLLFLTLLVASRSLAQNETHVTIKAETNIMDVMSAADVFLYPTFIPGRVYFKYGTITDAKLNYNKLVDEMHFIAPAGDTMAVSDEKTIKQIVIGRDTFYYDRGFVRLVAGGNVLKLALKQTWRISDTRKVGAMDTRGSHVAITSFINHVDASRLYNLVANEDMVLAKVNDYYIGDNNGHFVPASKKNLLSLLPKEDHRLEIYLKQNKVDFTDREDLEKIIRYLDL